MTLKAIPNVGWLGVLALFFLISCGSEAELRPRKHGYPHMELPSSYTYQAFSSPSCPFTFKYPDFGEVTRDAADSCWVDISFPALGCKWHISQRDIQVTEKNPEVHFEEHRKLVYKHSKKASQIRTAELTSPAGNGIYYELYGEVGTPLQFFLSDSSNQQFIIGSVYLNTALANDSLAPLIALMKGEIQRSVASLRWE
ncbi:MAG: hypothetical protein AAGI38_11005 [Bacteroidota bacterium]